ncbi:MULTISPECIES: OmpA family protein [unclassified Thiocapsa]|uniref:OmpA family protein n=1 Tax=unclassified Thiocapsa TaxID=2641286 RepID=UPI0035AD83F6
MTALRERNPLPFWSVFGVVGLAMLGLILSLLFGGTSWRSDLDRLQAELSGLGDRLKVLEVAAPKPVDPGRVWEALEDESLSLRNDVRNAVIAKATADVPGLSARLDDLEQRQQTVTEAVGADPKGARAQAMARQLASEYVALKKDVSVAQAAAPADDEEAQRAFRSLLVSADRGLKRAQRLAAPVAPPPAPPPELSGGLAAALGEARDGLETLSASVTISTNPLLAEALVLPVLNTCVADSAVRPSSDERHWFVASQDPEIAPGVLVSIADLDDPYRPLLAERADVVVADQTPDQQTQAEFSARFPGKVITASDHATVIALDAIALLGHSARPAAPVTDLSQDRWSTDTASAQVITRLAPTINVTLVEDPFATVQADPEALSVVLYHQLTRHPVGQSLAYQPSPDAPALKPTAFSIGTENYPLSYRILATQSPQSRPLSRSLVNCMTSDAGQSAVKSTGFADLTLLGGPAGPPADPLILSTLGTAVGRNVTSAQQFPTSLRFALNEAELDVKALADVQRLRQPLQAKLEQGNRVVILGFTDNTGTDSDNVRLSIDRAQKVSDRLSAVGVKTVTAGLGEQLPVDTNDTEAGRARNRRAEVWVVGVER